MQSPLPRATTDKSERVTRRAVLCGSAVVAALTIRWVERWTRSDRVGEASVVDPGLLDALRFVNLSDEELPAFSQWLIVQPNANPLGLVPTNATRVQLGAQLATRGIALVSSGDPAATTGRVRTDVTPVLRLVR